MEKLTEDLSIALESEVLGEAFFRSAYYAGFFSSRRNSAKVLWQLEIQTKNRILEYFAVNNIESPKLQIDTNIFPIKNSCSLEFSIDSAEN